MKVKLALSKMLDGKLGHETVLHLLVRQELSEIPLSRVESPEPRPNSTGLTTKLSSFYSVIC